MTYPPCQVPYAPPFQANFAVGMEPFERLREARRAAGFSGPTDAARRFHWKIETYKKHESGGRGITPRVAAIYGKAYRVNPSWILYGDGPAPVREDLSGQLDPVLLARSVAVSRRLLGPYPATAAAEPFVISAAYALLLRERDGHPAGVDDEATLRVVELLLQNILERR